MKKYTISFKKISMKDISLVGGKNGSLGEMISSLSKKGVSVPGGFAITTDSYWDFLEENGINEKLKGIFKKYNKNSTKSLIETGKKAREIILKSSFPEKVEKSIRESYREMNKEYGNKISVAVRSSAVCEDAPDASFAGQFETFLNISGEEELLKAVKLCIASSFSDRVIAYREEKNVPHLEFALSIGIQKMVRSDLASSGVMFTLDTESGFRDMVLINSIYGIGEMIVQGSITPDEFYIFKPTLKKGFDSIIRKDLGRKDRKYVYGAKGGLKEAKVNKNDALRFSINDKEILTLAKWAMIIEEHYKRPQDIEWAKDGETGKLFIVQSRPETVHAPTSGNIYKEYKVKAKDEPIITGIAVGDKIGTGKVKVIKSIKDIDKFKKGEVLVTGMTDPDWVSIMRLASAIVTDEGGKTAHASIVGRELGIPTIVGTGKGTEVLKEGSTVTVDCTKGLYGRVFKGKIDYSVKEYDLKKIPKTKTKVMLNLGTPETALKSSFLKSYGVGLARLEFIIAEKVKVHPLALYNYEKIKNRELKKKIDEITIEHSDKKEHFTKELAEGVAQIAAAFYPREVIIRLSDFKTNEYRNLVGGELYEGEESNPMLGFRGASRYLDKDFFPAFKMECKALKRVKDIFGLDNLSVMIPFCRTVEEGVAIRKEIKKTGLNSVPVYIMAELPSNITLNKEFGEVFDGFSIGSNDLTQLILGVDRDNAKLSAKYDENDEAVRRTVAEFLKQTRKNKKKVGICGEAPAIIPGFVEFLVDNKIDYISVNPDSFIQTVMKVHDKEKK